MMISLKTYVKWLSERNYLEALRPSDVPINKTILRQPVYLTKSEMIAVTNAIDVRVEEADKRYLKQFIFPSYVGRALVRMLYTT